MTVSFAYEVRDPRGNAHTGVIDAATADDAAQQLRRDGFQIVEIKEDLGEAISLIPRRVSRTEVMYVTNQLAVMIDTGIALSTAMEGIASQEQNPALKRVLLDLCKSVEQGDDFSTALSRHPKHFDKTYVSLIKAGEATGTLGPMLDRIANYLRKELESRGKVRAAMAYPMIMLVLGIGVTIFLLTVIMPKFTPLFASKGVKLPVPTKVLMVVSDVLLNYWWAWIPGIIVAVASFIYAKRTEPGRQAWDTFKINLPLMGPMTRKVVISRSIRTLGTMLSSGIPVLDALRLSADVAGNWNYEKLWQHVGQRVMEGSQMCEALASNPLFPPMLVQMISAGEQTGKLGPVLERVSTYYDQEVETSLKGLTSALEPMMITVMGAVIGTIGMAIMLPIFSLSKGGG